VNPIKANKSQDFFVNFYWLLLVSESITKKVRIIFFHFVAAHVPHVQHCGTLWEFAGPCWTLWDTCGTPREGGGDPTPQRNNNNRQQQQSTTTTIDNNNMNRARGA
jgi:hypothetical protein